MKHAAIPTVYNGVQMRSRLEARWAALFDVFGWKWSYEPIDLNGWIPDFIIYDVPPGSGYRILVEVKPLHEIDEKLCVEISRQAIASGEHWHLALLGVAPPDSCWLGIYDGSKHVWHGLTGLAPQLDRARKIWIEVGNAVQWKSPRKQVEPFAPATFTPVAALEAPLTGPGEIEDSPFWPMEWSQIYDWLTESTGSPPKGNPSHRALVRMADAVNAEIIAARARYVI